MKRRGYQAGPRVISELLVPATQVSGLCEPVIAVIAAWNGSDPECADYDSMRVQVRQLMPELANALDRLAADRRVSAPVDATEQPVDDTLSTQSTPAHSDGKED